MANEDNDIDRLWAAVNKLQSQVGSGGGGGSSGSGGGGGFTPPSGGGGGKVPTTPAEWIAGVIAQGLPPGGPQQMMQQAGGQDAQFLGSSVVWCTSRFVCATMSCGGSGWC